MLNVDQLSGAAPARGAKKDSAPTGDRFLRKLTPWDEGGKAGFMVFRVGEKMLELDVSLLSEEVKARAMYHGLSQKVGDSAASKTNAEKAAAMAEMIEQLYDGRWNAGRSTAGGTDLAIALSRIKKVPVEDAMAAMNRADEDTLKKWAKHPLVAGELTKIRAERAKERAKGAKADDIDLGI